MTTHELRPTELASDLKAIIALERAYGLKRTPPHTADRQGACLDCIASLCCLRAALRCTVASSPKETNMKRTILAAATAAISILAAGSASAQDFSDRNSGLTKQVMCSNVPAHSGSVGGFFIPTLGYFVMEAAADMATVDAHIIPAEFHPKDDQEVIAYLHSVGLTNFELVIRKDRNERLLVDGNGQPILDKNNQEQFYVSTKDGRWCK